MLSELSLPASFVQRHGRVRNKIIMKNVFVVASKAKPGVLTACFHSKYGAHSEQNVQSLFRANHSSWEVQIGRKREVI